MHIYIRTYTSQRKLFPPSHLLPFPSHLYSALFQTHLSSTLSNLTQKENQVARCGNSNSLYIYTYTCTIYHEPNLTSLIPNPLNPPSKKTPQIQNPQYRIPHKANSVEDNTTYYTHTNFCFKSQPRQKHKGR